MPLLRVTVLRTTVATAIVSLSALSATLVPARADSLGLWVSPGIGIGVGGVGIGVGVGVGVGVGHGFHEDVYYDGGHCSKGDALARAASLGVRKRYVSAISQTRVSVRGTHHGQPVKVTMYRHSDRCAVRSFDYL
jgi:hypothetical protein